MALKSTVYKAALQIADMDRSLYADHALTLARHPSETDERMMVRLLAFALNVPFDDHQGALTFGRGISDNDDADLWQIDLTGRVVQWIDVGQPDDRHLARACGKADLVTLYAYGTAVPVWWAGITGKLSRLSNLAVWRLPSAQCQSLAGLAERSMRLQVTVQEGLVWVGNGEQSVEITPEPLKPRG